MLSVMNSSVAPTVWRSSGLAKFIFRAQLLTILGIRKVCACRLAQKCKSSFSKADHSYKHDITQYEDSVKPVPWIADMCEGFQKCINVLRQARVQLESTTSLRHEWIQKLPREEDLCGPAAIKISTEARLKTSYLASNQMRLSAK